MYKEQVKEILKLSMGAEDVYEEWFDNIAQEICGLFLKGEKPPVLSDEELDKALRRPNLLNAKPFSELPNNLRSHVLNAINAQRDALLPYIQQARDSGWDEGYTQARLEGDRRVQRAIEQARQEVADKIFEEIEKQFPEFAHTERIDTGHVGDVDDWNDDTEKWVALKNKQW